MLKDQGKPDEAVACYRRALELKPDYAEAHNNLGNALKEQGKLDEAVACCRRALELKPDYAEAHNNLGVALKEQGKLDEAIACYRRALELKPDFAEAHNNLGNALKDQGKLDEAVACYRRALELKPDYAEAHNNLGNALRTREAGRSDRLLPPRPGTEAGLCRGAQQPGQCLEGPGGAGRSGRLLPPGTGTEAGLCGIPGLLGSCASTSVLLGRPGGPFPARDRGRGSGCRSTPDPAPVTRRSFSSPCRRVDYGPEQQLRCARRWVDRATENGGRGLDAISRPAQAGRRTPKSKITVGYLSADFHSHATAWLIAELIEKHDRDRFAVFGYSYGPDDVAR